VPDSPGLRKVQATLIPACASRLVSKHFDVYVLLASALGAICAVLGLLLSGSLDLPSGPCVVIVQLLGFLVAVVLASRPAAAWLSGRAAP